MIDIEQLLDNYINGKIVNPNVLKRLYDNEKFMKRLILRNRNQQDYNLCSNRLKTNIDFIIFLTKVFDHDLNFVFSVINNYVYTVGEGDKRFGELLYVIDGYLKNREFEFDYTYYMQYRCKILWYFDIKQERINSLLNKFDKDYQRENLFGFDIMKWNFNYNEKITEFFAKHYLDKMFYGYDFEDYIHEKYKSIEDINNSSSFKILAEYVRYYDLGLYEYALKNTSLLEDKVVRLNYVIDNFDSYNLKNNTEKVDLFNTKLIDYLEQEKLALDTRVDLIKLEEIKRLGLEKEFYGEEIEIPDFLKHSFVVDFTNEKLRLFIRTELQNLFKKKRRILELNNIIDEDI